MSEMVVRNKPNRGRAAITVDVRLPVAVPFSTEERELLVLKVTQAVGESVPMDRATVRVNVYCREAK